MTNRIRSNLERQAKRNLEKDETIMKMSKHHNLCDLVKKRFEEKGRGKCYKIVREEQEYGMQRVKHNGMPIIGECDDFALHVGSNGKRYLYVVEVKSSNTRKGRRKAYLQLAKDSVHYKQLFKADKVFAFYAHGYRDDKKGTRINYRYVPQSRLEQIIIK